MKPKGGHKMKTLLVALMALCLGISIQAEVILKENPRNFPTWDESPFRVYQDLGTRTPQEDSFPEGYLLLDNDRTANIQFGWPTYNQKCKLVIKDGAATWCIGEGETQSITSVPYQGTADENALYIDLFAQSPMTPSSPEKGISFRITKVNGMNISNGTISDTFVYPETSGGEYAVLTGFPDVNNLVVEGELEMINAQGANSYSYSMSIGTGNYEEPGPQGIVGLSAQTYTVDEDAMELHIPIARKEGSQDAVSVDYVLKDGTTIDHQALFGQDYSTSNGTVTFAPGETEKEVVVLIDNDRYPEEYKEFTIELENPEGGVVIDKDFDYAKITITDGDGNITDTDSDQMDDGWETETFGSLTVADETTDYDWDGILDIDEYYEMLDPKDPPVADALIGMSSASLIGEDIFDRTGTQQMLVSRKKRNATFWIFVKNSGSQTRKLAFRANGGDRNFSVNYFRPDGTDITAEVTGNTYSTPDLTPEDGELIRAHVTRLSKRGKRQFVISADVGPLSASPLRHDRVTLQVISKLK
jgi:hypothetical protein